VITGMALAHPVSYSRVMIMGQAPELIEEPTPACRRESGN
jgi:hypothetical protein